MKKVFIYSVLFSFSFLHITAQQRITTIGLQFKPIFPNSFLSTGTQTTFRDNATFDLTLRSGFSAGMIVRHGFSDLLAFESGINYVKRTYHLKISEGNFSGESRFRIVGYEIPLSLLVYIRLGEKIFMNASMGPSFDMFASDVQSNDYYFSQRSYRKSLFQPAVTANLGWEYRTLQSGYFYIGASYHRPFSYIYLTKITYHGNVNTIDEPLAGNYLTLDLRYFFYEDPKKKPRPRYEEDEQ